MKRVKYSISYLREAHRHSIYHEKEIIAGEKCGCFYCKKTFEVASIEEWTDLGSTKGKTAICPICGIDAILSDRFPIEDMNFLAAMKKQYFS